MKTKPFFRLLSIASFAALMLQAAGAKPAAALPAFDPAKVELQQVATGLSAPVFITHAGDARLFIVEQAGTIRIVKNGVLLPAAFLDISSLVKSGGEQGLLALAFHPSYASNHKFYVMYTDKPNGSLTLQQYTQSDSNPDLASPPAPLPILTIPHPGHSNHNGGTLAFSPIDGYLYWTTGDGGGGGDLAGNAQNLNTLLGKVLRLDVDSGPPYAIPATNPYANDGLTTTLGEIWAYGLRNPWRASFDRVTGDMFIGDVGQDRIEEIDFAPAGVAPRNYGWNVMEGNECFNTANFSSPLGSCNTSSKVLPITQYDHSVGEALVGGYRYHGVQSPDLEGRYFYGDEISGVLFALFENPAGVWTRTTIPAAFHNISTFGEDQQGEIYLADYGTGTIYRIAYPPQTPQVLRVFPPDGANACPRPAIGVELLLVGDGPSAQTLLVDTVDVTSLATNWELLMYPPHAITSYTPPFGADLVPGTQSAEFDYTTATGPQTATWSFDVVDILPCPTDNGALAPVLDGAPPSSSTDLPRPGVGGTTIP